MTLAAVRLDDRTAERGLHTGHCRPLMLRRPYKTVTQWNLWYEDRLKIDRLEDRTSLCLVKNENFLYHINVLV